MSWLTYKYSSAGVSLDPSQAAIWKDVRENLLTVCYQLSMLLQLTSEMFGMVAETAMNLSTPQERSLALLSPPSPQEREVRTVFIRLTMASIVGPRDSSFNW